jgi:hypothetical protein
MKRGGEEENTKGDRYLGSKDGQWVCYNTQSGAFRLPSPFLVPRLPF